MFFTLDERLTNAGERSSRTYGPPEESCEWMARDLIKELQSQAEAKDAEIERLREPMQEFCDRRDKGEVRSTYTYNKFKALLDV